MSISIILRTKFVTQRERENYENSSNQRQQTSSNSALGSLFRLLHLNCSTADATSNDEIVT